VDESHLDHPEEVLGGLFKTGEYPPAFFEPTDQPLNDVAVAIGIAVELDGSSRAVFVFFTGYHRLDP